MRVEVRPAGKRLVFFAALLALCPSCIALTVCSASARPVSAAGVQQSERESDLHYQRGVAALDKHDFAQAIRELRMAVWYSLKSPRAHNKLGEAYFENGQVDRAAIEFRRAIALRPVFPEAYYNMGRALQARDDFVGAVTFFQGAVRQRPDWAMAHYDLGLALLKKGEDEQGRAELEKAHDLDPHLNPPPE